MPARTGQGEVQTVEGAWLSYCTHRGMEQRSVGLRFMGGGMRHHPWFLFGLCLWLTACGEAEEQLDPGPVKWSSQPTMPLDLQQLIDDAEDGATVTIPEGTFTIEATVLSAVPCLNCEDDKPLTTTRGLLVSGKAVHLIGRGADRTRLRITAS